MSERIQQSAEPEPKPVSLSALRDEAIRSHQAGELDAALSRYRLYLSRRPGDASIWSNLGALHRAQKDYTAAVACQRRAVELQPEATDLLNNLGNALYDDGYLEEALEVRRRVAAAQPDQATPLQYVATALRGLNRYAEAAEVCDRGLAMEPDHNELKIQRAMARLALGDYEAGFSDFEARWQGDEVSKPEISDPEWDGSDPSGKTLLVMPEQGFGDTVLMTRFLPQLRARGARVLLAAKTPLMRLLAGIDGVDGLVELGSKKPPIDAWVSMMSLPRHLGLRMGNLPAPTRLTIPQVSRDRASTLLEPFAKRLRVGVLWSGSVTYRANHKRSFSHDMFYRLAVIPGIQLFSLYKGPLHEEFRRSGLSSIVMDASGSDRDFADTAALIERLDLVVSMDSAVVHVAGSIGAKVWNLLHYSAYWLYGPFPGHTPWYPSMRLIRQPAPDDWDSVFALLEEELTILAREKTA